jgi:TonB family protein
MFLQSQRCLLVLALFAGALFQVVQPAHPQSRDAQPQSSGTSKHPNIAASLDMVSDKDGIDFKAYLREVYFSVHKSWVGYNMPPSIEKGLPLQGKNTVEFRILRDGNIQKDSLKMIASSQKSELDTASLGAVREAAPFGHLPEKFSEPFIVLRMTFYYNMLPLFESKKSQ